MIRVVQLNLYPIKSCGGVAIGSAVVGPRGLEVDGIGDRRWMLSDAGGMMLTQRTRPKLALIGVELLGGRLRVTADGFEPLIVDPFEVEDLRAPIVLHGKTVTGCLSPARVDAWFSRYLGEAVRLLYQKDDDVRLCDENFAVAPGSDRVGFADAYPYLLANLATLERVNGILASPVPADRFRANITVGEAEADAEYGWKRVSVGAVEFCIVKPCTRCVMTTIDQARGVLTGKEPLAMLGREYFLSADFGEVRVQGAIFGENAIATRCGEIRLGDEVRVLEGKTPHVFAREPV